MATGTPVLDPLVLDAEGEARLRRARWRARLLDTAFRIPGTRITFGIEPLIGLVPWLGDAAGAVLSLLLVWDAHRLGVPGVVKVRMLLNVLLDTLAGAVPILGDLWDFYYKANRRNLALLERSLATGRPRAHGSDWAFVLGTVGAGIALVALPLLAGSALVFGILALVSYLAG